MSEVPKEQECAGGGTRLFQICETDLAELERLLPQWAERITMTPTATSRDRVQFRRVQQIIANVRWNYGPPTEVEIIPAGD